jgi:hypothetical protein
MNNLDSNGKSPSLVGAGESTGVPGLRTWKRLYAFVLGWFVVCVVLLLVLTEVFR